jgi:hypothetical protein
MGQRDRVKRWNLCASAQVESPMQASKA